MGLDMYLTKRSYVLNWDHHTPAERHAVTVTRGGQPRADIKPERGCYVVEQIGYWRKANQIHAWFVEHVQDGRDECQTSYVSRAQLKDLLSTVRTVLADHSRAPELLPTREGFFFGGTDYDDWYFKDLHDTEKILVDALADDCGDFEYRASW